MNLLCRCLLITGFAFFNTSVYAKNIYFSSLGVTIMISDSTSAAAVAMLPDEYTRTHTNFDRSIRLDKQNATPEEYLSASAKNVRNWTTKQDEDLRSAFAGIDAYLKKEKIKLHLPDTVMLIRTTAGEEFGAEGFTRVNRIFLNTEAEGVSEHLVAHELFHVLSRGDTSLRNASYAIFGFRPCNNIVYKQAMQNRVITNPDCPFLSHFVTVNIEGSPHDAAIVLYSKKGYDKGYVMPENLSIGILLLKGDDNHKEPMMKDGVAAVLELTDVPDLFNKISMNTEYVLHVEEIAAEHFATLVTGKLYPQPDFLTAMAQVLKAE
jgi:hypothetical protein